MWNILLIIATATNESFQVCIGNTVDKVLLTLNRCVVFGSEHVLLREIVQRSLIRPLLIAFGRILLEERQESITFFLASCSILVYRSIFPIMVVKVAESTKWIL